MRRCGWGRSKAAGDPLTALRHWLAGESGSEPASGAAATLAAIESRYGIVVPDDFRRYLVEVAPSAEFLDAEGVNWWPADRVRSIPDEYPHEVHNPAIACEANSYLVFADYLIWCWAWAICCSEGPNRGRVAFIGGPDDFVADSFSDFVERYLRNPDAMANTIPHAGGGAG